MLNLDYEINFVPISLGDVIDSETVQEAELRRLGFWGVLLIGKPRNTVVYWAKNSCFSCLKRRIAVSPQLDSTSELTSCATSSYLYTVDGVVRKVVCQLLGNRLLAMAEYDAFLRAAPASLGDSVEEGGGRSVWMDSNTSVTSELTRGGQNWRVEWTKVD